MADHLPRAKPARTDDQGKINRPRRQTWVQFFGEQYLIWLGVGVFLFVGFKVVEWLNRPQIVVVVPAR